GRHDFFGLIKFGQLSQAVIRHRHNAGVRLNGSKRVISRQRVSVRQRIKQCALANIWQTHNSNTQSHAGSLTDYSDDLDRCDGHQFLGPSNDTIDGTSRVRTKNVSSKIPKAMPKPICSTCSLPPTIPRIVKVPARINPAEVTVVPVIP